MSQQVSSNPVQAIEPLLVQARTQIEKYLPRHLDADKMIYVALETVRADSFLRQCEPLSIVQAVLEAVSAWNDRVQAFLFRPRHLAPTFSEAEVLKPPRFNAYYDIEDVKPVDAGSWKLELAGLIKDKRPWTAGQLSELPEQELIIRHICVEGWDYIGQWSGVNLRYFLERIGADLTARYVAFKCADDYTESIDMATALHPQTILATKYARQPITDPFGFPLRLRTATKLGFKNPKWITALEVTNIYTKTYWAERGFNWFAGI